VTRTDLDKQSRDDLIARAKKLGVNRPEVMTRVELADEIVRREVPDPNARRRARGWLGVARDLVASLIEDGLNLPDAAALVRQGVTPTRIVHQAPVATVTLAEIYATQGHVSRALKMLDEVLDKEPDHTAARSLRDRLARENKRSTPPPPEPEPEPELAPLSEEPASEPTLASAVEEIPPVVKPEREKEIEHEEPEPEPESEPEPQPEKEIEHEHAVFEPVEAPLSPEPIAGPVTPAITPTSDVVIAIRATNGTVYVYWELSAATEARARARHPSGRAVVKIATYRPGFGIAHRLEREFDAALPSGAALVPGIAARSIVRVALGWKTSDDFRALAVGSELEKGDGERARVRYAPIGQKRSVELEAAERRAFENLSRAQT